MMKQVTIHVGLLAVALLPGTAQSQEVWELTQLEPDVYVTVVSDPLRYSQHANSLIVVGDRSVLVVDSRDTEEAAADLIRQIRTITDKPVSHLVNTHWHWDHVNGNAVFRDSFPDLEIIAHPESARLMMEEGPSRLEAEIERLQTRVERLERFRTQGATDAGEALTPEDFVEVDRLLSITTGRIAALQRVRLQPPTRLLADVWKLDDFGPEVVIQAPIPAHSAGDLVVWLPTAAVLFMGDLIEYRAPYTEDGRATSFRASLNGLASRSARFHVPSHGPVPSDVSLFEGQRAFWNTLEAFARSPLPDSLELSASFLANVDTAAFAGALDPAGEPTEAFGAWLANVVGQVRREVPEILEEWSYMRACPIDDRTEALVQEALDRWEGLSTRLRVPRAAQVPWAVVVGSDCRWHMNPNADWAAPRMYPGGADLFFVGAEIPVWSGRHRGEVEFPNGQSVGAQPMAATYFDSESASAFLAIAALPVWMADSVMRTDPNLEPRLLTALVHEFVHTVHMPAVARDVAELETRFALPASVNELLVQSTYDTVPSFVDAYERERDLLFASAAAEDVVQAWELAKQALAVADRRRAAHYAGDRAVYAHLEDRFLLMEGVAEWARYQTLLGFPEVAADHDARVEFLRGTDNEWAQDEGLALFLALDRLAPDWMSELARDQLPSPFALLRAAVEERR